MPFSPHLPCTIPVKPADEEIDIAPCDGIYSSIRCYIYRDFHWLEIHGTKLTLFSAHMGKGEAFSTETEGNRKRSQRIWGEHRGQVPLSFHSLSSLLFFFSHLSFTILLGNCPTDSNCSITLSWWDLGEWMWQPVCVYSTKKQNKT